MAHELLEKNFLVEAFCLIMAVQCFLPLHHPASLHAVYIVVVELRKLCLQGLNSTDHVEVAGDYVEVLRLLA